MGTATSVNGSEYASTLSLCETTRIFRLSPDGNVEAIDQMSEPSLMIESAITLWDMPFA